MLLPSDWLDRDLSDIARIAPVQKITLPALADRSISLLVKREDLLHPLIGGNKIYKLHAYIRDYLLRGDRLPLATFGGAFSNHILALAALGHMLEIKTLGIIRGERADALSPTLRDAQACGMQLHFVSRSEYRLRNESEFISSLEKKLGPAWWIPEGGAGNLGVSGMADFGLGIADLGADAVFHACGTGSSFAGLIKGFARAQIQQPKIYGVPVLKNNALKFEINSLLNPELRNQNHWQMLDDYHWGGYAKFPAELRQFCLDFEAQTGIPLDPVYTSKMIYAAVDLAKKNVFHEGAQVLLIHSGGLQGRRGFNLNWRLACDDAV